MKENNPAEIASKIVNHTGKNVFLTGKAGTGKTTFLKHIVANTHKKCVVAAPTGIAAINASGVTLHSLFQLPFGSFVPESLKNSTPNSYLKINDPQSLIKNLQLNANKRSLLREMELLIIDEVSMLRADLLDAIDVILRSVRKNYAKAFGGVQVLFIGDLLQLPPVVKDAEWQILRNYYNSIYFFDAKVLQQEKPVYIELEKIYRQADTTFISLLNNLRTNSITQADLQLLNSFYKSGFKPSPNHNYITLTTHNVKADKINKEYLTNLNTPSFFYKAKISGDFNESAYPIEENLELKVGAQVMFVKNDASGAQRFFNGKIGIIHSLSDKEIKVQFSDSIKPITVETYEWQNIKYVLNETTNEIEEKVIGSFVQYPIKLAWAITVHKSQGLTFDKAIVDIGDVFAPGQAYVALSRLRSLEGLVLNSPINYKGIDLNEHVTAFSNTKIESSDLAEQVLQEQTNYLLNVLLQSFSFIELLDKFQEHAISYRLEKKKSVKFPHKVWAEELLQKLETAKVNADKFQNQLRSLLGTHIRDYSVLLERLQAANGYFLPILEEVSNSIFDRLKEIKNQKRVKAFITELLALEAEVFGKIVALQKNILLTEAVSTNSDLTKSDINKISKTQVREEKIKTCLQKDELELSETKSSKRKSSKKEFRDEDEFIEQEVKAASKEQTYALFKEGLAIEEIALARKMAQSTIEGHLVQYVATGQLDCRKFVSVKKEKEIIATAKALNSFKLGEIKNALSDEYSYSEIKFAIAGYLAGVHGD